MKDFGVVHPYRALDNALAQIEAAEEFYGQVDAYIADMWEDIYVDASPSEEDVEEAVSPFEMLGSLMGIGLRFDLAGRKDEEYDEGYFSLKIGGSIVDTLLYGWAHQAMDAVQLDPRAFEAGLRPTDLIFVPDTSGVVHEAYNLYLKGMATTSPVRTRYDELERAHRETYKGSKQPKASRPRGEGPRTVKPAMIDRVALTLRGAPGPMSAEDVAKHLKHKNVQSLAAALHQVVMYRKPKRLAGWILRDDTGHYRWAP